MKKLFIMTFFILALLLSASPVLAATEDTTQVKDETDIGAFVDGEETKLTIVYGDRQVVCENAAIRSGDVTYLPMREVMEAYELTLEWAVGEAEEKVVLITKQGRYQVVMDLKKAVAYGLNEKTYLMKHEDSVVYLPVNFFADVFNCSVSWDSESGVFAILADKKKQEATIFNEKTGGISYKILVNLPEYEKTVSSRSAALASRQTISSTSSTVYEKGIASYYGGKFHGRRTSSGAVYDMHAMTAAHKTLPFGTVVRVTALWNGKTVDVKITDRGPYSQGRVIDLSTAAAKQIDMMGKGIGPVSLTIVSYP